MGALIGLLFGIGLLLAWQSGPRRRHRAPHRSSFVSRTDELLTRAGIEAVRPGQFYALIGTCGLVAFIASVAVSSSPTIAFAFAIFGGAAPVGIVRYRERRRMTELRDLWPEVVDNIASAVRAGMALPEAVAEIAVRGPESLRRPFQRFAID